MLTTKTLLGLLLSLRTGAAADTVNAFERLSDAYAKRDPVASAAAYSASARVVYRYRGKPERQYVGLAEIEQSFRDFFARVDPSNHLDLNFRVTSRDNAHLRGLYRLRSGARLTSYGHFEVELSQNGMFQSDISSEGSRDQFEDAKGPVMLHATDEDLDGPYYDRFLGRYRLPDGCKLAVTRSVVRLFVRNTCTQAWRGLNRVSGHEWTAGSYVSSKEFRSTFRFASSESAIARKSRASAIG